MLIAHQSQGHRLSLIDFLLNAEGELVSPWLKAVGLTLIGRDVVNVRRGRTTGKTEQ